MFRKITIELSEFTQSPGCDSYEDIAPSFKRLHTFGYINYELNHSADGQIKSIDFEVLI